MHIYINDLIPELNKNTNQNTEIIKYVGTKLSLTRKVPWLTLIEIHISDGT